MGSSPAYPSDLTDAQWALIEPLVPARSSRGKGTRGGRPLKYSRRREYFGGRPPRVPRPRVLRTGTSGSINAHCASVRSEG